MIPSNVIRMKILRCVKTQVQPEKPEDVGEKKEVLEQIALLAVGGFLKEAVILTEAGEKLLAQLEAEQDAEILEMGL